MKLSAEKPGVGGMKVREGFPPISFCHNALGDSKFPLQTRPDTIRCCLFALSAGLELVQDRFQSE